MISSLVFEVFLFSLSLFYASCVSHVFTLGVFSFFLFDIESLKCFDCPAVWKGRFHEYFDWMNPEKDVQKVGACVFSDQRLIGGFL